MIIWGFRARMKTLGEGTFFSPALGGDAPYRLVEARRWFTLFFIPLIPLKVLGTFVECQATKATYDPKILDNPTNSEFTDQLSSAVREVVATVASADGMVSANERQLALALIGKHVAGYNETDFDGDLARVGSAPLSDRLTYLSGALNEGGKEQLLMSAATIMTSDGAVDDRDRDAVTDIGRQLAMSEAHIRGVIAAATDSINTQ